MNTTPGFKNRLQAGKLLAAQLSAYAHRGNAIVLALPRGGVPVGFAVARALDLELDVLLVRKLGLPGHAEYAMGAIASGGVRVINPEALREHRVSPEQIEAASAHEMDELNRRERQYRAGRPPPELAGRTVILVDDGLATGSTMRAAIAVARREQAGRVVVAVPVGAPDTCATLASQVDELVCLSRPPFFRAVSQWYRQFEQTTDDEVQDMLALAWHVHPAASASTSARPLSHPTGG